MDWTISLPSRRSFLVLVAGAVLGAGVSAGASEATRTLRLTLPDAGGRTVFRDTVDNIRRHGFTGLTVDTGRPRDEAMRMTTMEELFGVKEAGVDRIPRSGHYVPRTGGGVWTSPPGEPEIKTDALRGAVFGQPLDETRLLRVLPK